MPKFLYGGIFVVSFVYLVSGLPKIDPNFREALWQTATCVRSLVSEEEMILTPFPIVAVEADRRVPRDMTMGLFALTLEIEPGRARRLHLTSTQELLRLIGEKEPAAVILNNFPSKWNFNWSVPSLRPANKDHTDLFFKMMEENYFMVFGKRPFAVMLQRPPYPPDQGRK